MVMANKNVVVTNMNDKEYIKKQNAKFAKMSKQGADEMAKNFGMSKPKKKTTRKTSKKK